jgi:hypothetical protein
MAYFSRVDENNLVTDVQSVNNSLEERGQEFLANDLGLGGRWVQTSYNLSFRKNFGNIGYFYNESLDAFIPPKPYESWTLNETTCRWEAPVAEPKEEATDGGINKIYSWNEPTLNWVEITGE